VHGFAPWSGRSELHHIEFSSGVIDAWVHMGPQMIQSDILVGKGIQWCTWICCSVQWAIEEYMDTWWYAVAYGAT